MKGQLQISADSVKRKNQHTSPCSDCPWARKSLKSWLGGTSVIDWLIAAHGEGRIECHTRIAEDGSSFQCAGAATYRHNVCKSVVQPNLELPVDRIRVFSDQFEFAAHHGNLSPKKVSQMMIAETIRILSGR